MSDDNDISEFIESHIRYIRKMNLLTDEQLRMIFKMKAIEDSSIIDKFKENRIKKQFNEIASLAKDIKTNPTKLGRKVA